MVGDALSQLAMQSRLLTTGKRAALIRRSTMRRSRSINSGSSWRVAHPRKLQLLMVFIVLHHERRQISRQDEEIYRRESLRMVVQK